MGQSRRHGTHGPENDWAEYDLEGMGLRVLSGRRLGFAQRRAGFVALASDVDDDGGVAAVWLVRHPGSVDSAQHTLEFERSDGWRSLGGASSNAQEFSLDHRPSASVHGPASMLKLVSSSASRSWTDRERLAGGLGVAGAGWVACAGFRVAAEVRHLQAGDRVIPVARHGYAVVAWRSPPTLTRPLIVALSNTGSRLTELRPHDSLDSLSWEVIEQVLLDEPPPSPG